MNKFLCESCFHLSPVNISRTLDAFPPQSMLGITGPLSVLNTGFTLFPPTNIEWRGGGMQKEPRICEKE